MKRILILPVIGLLAAGLSMDALGQTNDGSTETVTPRADARIDQLLDELDLPAEKANKVRVILTEEAVAERSDIRRQSRRGDRMNQRDERRAFRRGRAVGRREAEHKLKREALAERLATVLSEEELDRFWALHSDQMRADHYGPAKRRAERHGRKNLDATTSRPDSTVSN